jgi:glyoxalase family protein
MQLHGLHHVTAVTANTGTNKRFYTQTLGLRLVKKSVNQDDTSAYHLFYADKVGSPGTDITFFDWPHAGANRRGADSIANTMFRVNGALDYWASRFDVLGVKHEPISQWAGRSALRFEDPEGQRLMLIDDGGAPYEGELWTGSDVPTECALRGFYGITLHVRDFDRMAIILTQALNFAEMGHYTGDSGESVVVFGMDGGGAGKEVHIIEQRNAPRAILGRGGVHHAAFRLRDEAEQREWESRLARIGIPTSGQIDRFWFKSLYFRISEGILFELATDGPGFTVDESLDTLGEKLVLPPFLEPRRAQIEAGLKPIT